MSCCRVKRSTSFPLASSPHCNPMTQVAGTRRPFYQQKLPNGMVHAQSVARPHLTVGMLAQGASLPPLGPFQGTTSKPVVYGPPQGAVKVKNRRRVECIVATSNLNSEISDIR